MPFGLDAVERALAKVQPTATREATSPPPPTFTCFRQQGYRIETAYTNAEGSGEAAPPALCFYASFYSMHGYATLGA